MGENFCLPVLDTNRSLLEFIKCVEHNLRKLPVGLRSTIRNRVLPIINNLTNFKLSDLSNHDKFLIYLAKLTGKFIRDNPNLLFTRADKGSVTVAMERHDYLTKMTNLLNDEDT